MPNTMNAGEYNAETLQLAQKHYQIEEGITDIFHITDQFSVEIVRPIKLLEVNQNTVPSGIMPIQFGADPASGIPFPSVILEVTPEEFHEIKLGKLRLPNGWGIGERIPEPDLEAGE